MTTIVYYGGKLYSDTQLTMGGIRSTGTKLFLINGCKVAISGCRRTSHALLHWLANKETTTYPKHDNEAEMLVVTNEIVQYYTISQIPEIITAKLYTMGSGGSLAEAAVLAGKTPEEAIKIAAKLCIYTNDIVESI